MTNLTPEQIQKAFELLKAKGVKFPHKVTLNVQGQVTNLIFYDDGTYKED